MKIKFLLFGYILQGNASHEISRRNAGPIDGDNLCIIECRGKTQDWTDYATGITTYGNLCFY